MELFSNEQMRLILLVAICALIWSLESAIPLFQSQKNRVRHALPNVALTIILVLTNLALSFTTAYMCNISSQYQIGLFFLVGASGWIVALCGIIVLDLFAYFAHVLLHKSWLGWQFHRVHHSDGLVDVSTAFRQHPGETIWRILWRLAAILIFGIPLSVAVLYVLLSGIHALLEHANVRMPRTLDQSLRLLLVTPHMHKVHHSRDQIETDSNYSNIFSIWDRLFGTYTREANFQKLNYRLDGFDVSEKQTLTGLLKMPFVS
jgi:sterol desaturase/sphingolipid hydroxylase (fatty acid hydroxylase superfamily)